VTEHPRLRGDAGQVAPMTVILVVSILALSGLVLDGGRLLAARREANAVAAGAARAGAQAVDAAAVRASGSGLDAEAATASAQAYLDSSGVEGTVVVAADEVTVTVTKTAHPVLLSLVGMGDRPVTGHGTARLVRGL